MPNKNAVISLDEMLLHMPQVTKDEEVYVEKLINSASTYLEGKTHRYFVTRELAQRYDGTGDKMLILRTAPATPTKIIDDDGELPASAYTFDPGAGIIYRTDGKKWAEGFRNVEVTLNVGYGTRDDVPEDIKHAARLLVTYWFFNRDTSASSSMGGMTVDYSASTQTDSLPNNIDNLIEPYVRELF